MSWSRENWSREHWFRESWSQETKSNIDYNWSSVVTRWNPFTFLIWWLVYELHSGLQNWHMQYMCVANPQDEFYNTSGIRYEHNILTSSLAWCNHFREFGHEIETRVRVRVRTGTGGVDLGTRSDHCRLTLWASQRGKGATCGTTRLTVRRLCPSDHHISWESPRRRLQTMPRNITVTKRWVLVYIHKHCRSLLLKMMVVSRMTRSMRWMDLAMRE